MSEAKEAEKIVSCELPLRPWHLGQLGEVRASWPVKSPHRLLRQGESGRGPGVPEKAREAR